MNGAPPPPRGLHRRWPRLPRRTVRLRLTVVYGGLFLLSDVALLTITYLLVSRHLPAVPVTGGPSTRSVTGGPSPGIATPPRGVSAGTFFVQAGNGRCRLLTGPARTLAQVAARAQQCLSQQRALELNQLLTESGTALAIMTVVSAGLGWLVAGRVLRKLRTITAAARSISARAAGPGRPGRRAHRTRRHVRRPAGPPGSGVRRSAQVRGQRLARAAHPPGQAADAD